MKRRYIKRQKISSIKDHLIQQNAVLYRYRLETGEFKKYPQVYIYQKDNMNLQGIIRYAVGIQYMVSTTNKRYVSKHENTPYYSAMKKDIVLWTTSLNEAEVYERIEQKLYDILNDRIDSALNNIQKAKNLHDIYLISNQKTLIQTDAIVDLRKAIKSYIYDE